MVTVKKPGRRPAKGANHAYDGIFLRYDNTLKNCVYVDTKTGRVKTARIDTFDEAHYSTSKRPPGPQQLLNVGVRQNTTVQAKPLPVHISESPNKTTNKPIKKLLVELRHQDAVPPIQSTDGSAGYDLCSCEEVTIEPGGVACVNLGIAIQLPKGTYGRIAP